MGHPRPRAPLRRQTYIHNGSSRNELCDCVLAAERSPGERVSHRWWYQDNLDLEGIQLVEGTVDLEEEEEGDEQD